jgi:uncharacterized membrane protein YozB (DUF420 family)
MGIIPGSRAPFVFDVVVLAMPMVLIAIAISIFVVRHYQNYILHRKIQTVNTVLLGVVIIWFEFDVRTNGWQEAAKVSPHYDGIMFPALYIHIACALATLVTWSWQMWSAWRKFATDRISNVDDRRNHRWVGKAAATLMGLTTLTGWIFYMLAFIA